MLLELLNLFVHAYFQQLSHIIFRSSRSQVFFEIGFLNAFRNIRRKTPALESLFNKFAGLNPIQMDFFGVAHGQDAKEARLYKICYAHSTMMKLGTGIPYLKKMQKIYESHDMSIFSPEISTFCYIEKYTDCFLLTAYYRLLS